MTTVTDRVLAGCVLRPGPWPPAPKTCIWCAAPLSGRLRRWCAGGCDGVFTRNHQWQSARAAAVKRDGGVCVQCGRGPEWPEGDAVVALMRFLCPPPVAPRLSDFADERRLAIEGPLHSDPTWKEWRRHCVGLMAPWRSAAAVIDGERRQRQLEVNHKIPIMGKHAQFGCHHHLDRLESLCHRCHVRVTARQFGYKTAVFQEGML